MAHNTKIEVNEESLKEAFALLDQARYWLGYAMGGGETNRYGFKRIRKCLLEDINPGDVFEYGESLFVMSEYRMGEGDELNKPDAQHMCIILGSGEYAWFKNGNKTEVYQLAQPHIASEGSKL